MCDFDELRQTISPMICRRLYDVYVWLQREKALVVSLLQTLHRCYLTINMRCRKKWARQGSNLPPAGYEPAALPLSYGPVSLAYARSFQGVKASGTVSPAGWGLGGSR